MSALALLAFASALFVGTHFAMSHPLRAGLVAKLGDRGFLGAYSLISVVTLGAMVHFYHGAKAAAPDPLWSSGNVGWWAATLLMWLGSILFVGSLRRNPAFPTAGKPVTQIGPARGVFAITRHPMLWGFMLWAVVHAMVNATPAALIVSGAIILLSLAGGIGQDAKKEKLIGEAWRDWKARTSFVPFGRGFALPDGFALIGGTLSWLAATWAHGALGYLRAGVFHFIAT